jgi:alpha-L-fucosidase
MKRWLLLLSLLPTGLLAQSTDKALVNLNKPDRETWFTSLGFGLFIHWSVDVQYGFNISHNLRFASEDYIQRYFNELPSTFDPAAFNPAQWAKMARMSGMKYVVFTAKHHNGFCMWHTSSTNFSIQHTPYKKDILKATLDAFRKEGLAIGIYFSPDDFWFLHQQGKMISREHPSSFARNNAELDAYDKKQLRELLSGYGPIDILFLDGNDEYGKTELAKLAWSIEPDIVVTRGAMATPEQVLPNKSLPSPWEACYTLSDSWSYRPTNESFKTAANVILKWIEIRAKGGNFLLNASPDADGVISKEQTGILNEVGAWWFLNKEVVQDSRPWTRPQSDSGYYFLEGKNGQDLYIVIPGKIVRKTWYNLFIENISVSDKAQLSIVGHSSFTDEKEPATSKPMTVKNEGNGIRVEFVFNQRIYNSYRVEDRWANPIVLKITNYRKGL